MPVKKGEPLTQVKEYSKNRVIKDTKQNSRDRRTMIFFLKNLNKVKREEKKQTQIRNIIFF